MHSIALADLESPPALLDLPVPEPDPGEVLVRVHTASVNGFDLAVASGILKDVMEHRFPAVLGKDFAGTVEAVGEGVTRVVVGDEVFGTVMKPFVGDGSFAEYVTVPGEHRANQDSPRPQPPDRRACSASPGPPPRCRSTRWRWPRATSC